MPGDDCIFWVLRLNKLTITAIIKPKSKEGLLWDLDIERVST